MEVKKENQSQVPKLNPSSPFPSLCWLFTNSHVHKRKPLQSLPQLCLTSKKWALVSPWPVQVDSQGHQMISWLQQSSTQNQQLSIKHSA